VRLPDITVLIAADLSVRETGVLGFVSKAESKYTFGTVVYPDHFRDVGNVNI
jgi:hypothetical protein